MNSVAVEPCSWTPRRLGLVVVLLVAAQVGLVFWLGDKSPVKPRQANTEPEVFWAPGYADELTALNNPTLFAWASPHGFSKAAWLDIPPLEYQPFEWSEPPRFLALDVTRLGAIFRQVVEQNVAPAFQIAPKPEPQILLPKTNEAATSLPTRSTLRVAGGLAGRRLLSQFDLPSWSAGDILADSIVQVMVDADGQTQSATLLSGSGSKEADQRALDLATSAEWEPRRRGANRLAPGIATLSWGRLIFSWHTVPLPATNPPPANP